nr:MFS transporter [Hyphomonas sp. Mor2]
MANAKATVGPTHPLMIAIIVGAASFSLNGAVPISDALGEEMVFSDAARSISTAFIFGYGVGHLLVGATISPNAARLALIAGITGFVFASAGAALSTETQQILAFRFLQGLFISVCPVLGRLLAWRESATEASAKTLSLATSIFTWIPVFAPLLVVAMLQLHGWRAGYVLIGAYGLAALIVALQIQNLPIPPNRSPRPRSLYLHKRIAGLARTPQTVSGLISVAAAFSGFFLFLASPSVHLVLRGIDPGLATAIATSVIAGAFAIGGLLSRLLLQFWSSEQVLVRTSFFLMITAFLWSLTIGLGVHGLEAIGLAVLYCCLAGTIIPNATIRVLSSNHAEPVLSLSIIGGAKMLVAAMTGALAIQFQLGQDLLFGGTILGLAVLTWAPNIIAGKANGP